MDDLHGPSLPFENVEVLSLDDEGHFVCKGPMMTGTAFYMGKTAVLSIKGTYVLYYIILYYHATLIICITRDTTQILNMTGPAALYYIVPAVHSSSSSSAF
eukprot:COSAG06_NODE_5895_length_3225_cov_1.698656_4_plen_101_part_00